MWLRMLKKSSFQEVAIPLCHRGLLHGRHFEEVPVIRNYYLLLLLKFEVSDINVIGINVNFFCSPMLTLNIR